MMDVNDPLKIEVVDGKLSITIGIETLADSINASDYFKGWEEFDFSPNEDYYAVKVIDPEQFAKDMVLELKRENEVGDTELYKLLDKAAIEAGSFSVELNA